MGSYICSFRIIFLFSFEWMPKGWCVYLLCRIYMHGAYTSFYFYVRMEGACAYNRNGRGDLMGFKTRSHNIIIIILPQVFHSHFTKIPQFSSSLRHTYPAHTYTVISEMDFIWYAWMCRDTLLKLFICAYSLG